MADVHFEQVIEQYISAVESKRNLAEAAVKDKELSPYTIADAEVLLDVIPLARDDPRGTHVMELSSFNPVSREFDLDVPSIVYKGQPKPGVAPPKPEIFYPRPDGSVGHRLWVDDEANPSISDSVGYGHGNGNKGEYRMVTYAPGKFATDLVVLLTAVVEEAEYKGPRFLRVLR